MKCLGLALAALTLAFSSFAAAQEAPPPLAQDEPTLQQSDAPAEQRQRQPGRYFIDFRSRSALSYGHTFVVFGRTGQRLTRNNVAGLHPKGDSSLTYMIGHILPVDSETGASDGDLEEQYTTARFRVWLTPQEYHTVVRHIRELQASTPAWHAATFNCNAFAGIIAHFVGLSSPPTWLLPEDFVNSMRRMNEGQHRIAYSPSGRDAMARHTGAPARR